MRTLLWNAVGNGASKYAEVKLEKRLLGAAAALVGTSFAPGVGSVLGYVMGVLIESAISEVMDSMVDRWAPNDNESRILSGQREIAATANATHRYFARARTLSIAGLRGVHGLLRSRLLTVGTSAGAQELEHWARVDAAQVPAPKPDGDQSLATALLADWARQHAASPTEASEGTSQPRWEAAARAAFGARGLRDQPDLFISQLRARLGVVGVSLDALEERLARFARDDDPALTTAARAETFRARRGESPINLTVRDFDKFCRHFKCGEEVANQFRPAFLLGNLQLVAYPGLRTENGTCYLDDLTYTVRWHMTGLWTGEWTDADLGRG